MVSRPHGNRLVQLYSDRRRLSRREFDDMIKITASYETAIMIENIGDGILSPVDGFMTSDEFDSVLEEMRLTNDLPWTIPIVLRVEERFVSRLVNKPYVPQRAEVHDDVLLCYPNDAPFAIVKGEELFKFNKMAYAKKVYGTTDASHPGVANVFRQPNYALAGKVVPLARVPNQFARFTLTPSETRVLFEEKGWKTIVAFQTRNAPHIGHEYVQKIALAFTDGLFINPVIGKKKKGDFKDEVIVDAYLRLIEYYYPKNSVVFSVLRYEMQYAGPREAVMHAIMRKNFGCTHIAIGRDHAGVGNFYKPYAAQEIFNKFPDLGITPLFFKEFFYCKRCEGISNEKICPHGGSNRLTFSGTTLRNLFLSKQAPPKEYMRPEVSDVILKHPSPFVE
jgi:sulfate adenylyltransferase